MTDKTTPWIIKNVQPEVRNAAIAAAARECITVGEWLSRAVIAQVQSDSQQDQAPGGIDPV